jgi:hypothetical protein
VLFFERGADVPQKMRREISENSWEVVDAHAYPKILLIGTDGSPYAPTNRDVSMMIACALALAELTEKHGRDLDARRPVRCATSVDGLSGPIRIRLVSPHPALEPDEGKPLSSYDAGRAPKRHRWLKMSEGDRMDQVETYHEESRPHPPASNPTMHAITHVVVETQLALDDPPEVRKALERLLEGGIERHEAIHAIGTLVTEHILGSMQEGGKPDSGSYVEALGALSASTLRNN